MKILNDRYKKLSNGHRTAVTRNVTAGGIIEVRGERELTFDDIILVVDEHDEKRRAERNERTELDERFRVRIKEMRDMAINRRAASTCEVEDMAHRVINISTKNRTMENMRELLSMFFKSMLL